MTHSIANKWITDRRSLVATSYVDIKSKQLQEVLIDVLEDVRGTCLREDKSTVRAFQSLQARWLTLQADSGCLSL